MIDYKNDYDELMQLLLAENYTDAKKAKNRINLKDTINESFVLFFRNNFIKFFMRDIKVKKTRLIESLNSFDFNVIFIVLIKIITARFNQFKTALRFIDTQTITENILTQTTYYKTLTSRP